jgi:DNA invertase Pin-like site-specific DNA recombinase
MGIDTGAPMGKAMAHIAVVFAELEQDLIRMRTYVPAGRCRSRKRTASC